MNNDILKAIRDIITGLSSFTLNTNALGFESQNKAIHDKFLNVTPEEVKDILLTGYYRYKKYPDILDIIANSCYLDLLDSNEWIPQI
jgi:hypothetical protein